MRRVLEKMAKTLNEYDETSLMLLWQEYAEQVHAFEPTKRWEEATISLCFIQAVHWKNQLFNYHLALTARPAEKNGPLPEFFGVKRKEETQPAEMKRSKATLLSFPGKMTSPGQQGAAISKEEASENSEGDASLTGDELPVLE